MRIDHRVMRSVLGPAVRLLVCGGLLLLAACQTSLDVPREVASPRAHELRSEVPVAYRAGPRLRMRQSLVLDTDALPPPDVSGRFDGFAADDAPPPPPVDDAPMPPPVEPTPEPLETMGGTNLQNADLPTQDTMIGGGFAVPSSGRRGIGGSRFHGSLAFRAPDVWEAGIFYVINSRWTVGIVGQRLEQKRTVSVDGQLIDPNDLGSFISGFSVTEEATAFSVGPFVQFRITPERGWMPEVSVAALALELGTLTDTSTSYTNPNLIINKEESQISSGDDADKYRTIFFAASKSIPIRSGGFFRGARGYGGAGYAARTGSRYATAFTGAGDPRIKLERKDVTRHSFVGWIGAETFFPNGFSAYGEWFTGDECEAGYGFGIRWMSPFGVSFTLGLSECYDNVAQRALDLVYLPGGVGGQPSVVTGGTGIGGGGTGYQLPRQNDDADDAAGEGRR